MVKELFAAPSEKSGQLSTAERDQLFSLVVR